MISATIPFFYIGIGKPNEKPEKDPALVSFQLLAVSSMGERVEIMGALFGLIPGLGMALRLRLTSPDERSGLK